MGMFDTIYCHQSLPDGRRTYLANESRYDEHGMLVKMDT